MPCLLSILPALLLPFAAFALRCTPSPTGSSQAPPPEASAAQSERRVLRVCADPNNLPFSSRRLDGFENRLASLLSRELDADLEYTWWPQRRGFFRNTLKARLCDIVIGVPKQLEMVSTTDAFYRSRYVFVARAEGPRLHSLDDPILRRLKIGVHLIGDDYANSPPVHALSRRNVTDNLVGYRLLGDYSEETPPARLVEGVAEGAIDVAIVWGPLGGYLAARSDTPLTIHRIEPSSDEHDLPLTYDMALGVRHGEEAFKSELNRALESLRDEIRLVLSEYHVPLLALTKAP